MITTMQGRSGSALTGLEQETLQIKLPAVAPQQPNGGGVMNRAAQGMG
jgi:hypothetical protein